jgi:hypothetical protein
MESGGSKTKARGKAKTAKPKAAVANGNGTAKVAKKPKTPAKKTPTKAASKAH